MPRWRPRRPHRRKLSPRPAKLSATHGPSVYKRLYTLPTDKPPGSCVPAEGTDGVYIGDTIDGGGRDKQHLQAISHGTSLHYLAAKIAELLRSRPLLVVEDDIDDLAAELPAVLPSLAALGLLKTPRQWLEAFLIVAEAVYTILDRTCHADVLYNDAVTRHSGPPPSNIVALNTQNCLTSGVLGIQGSIRRASRRTANSSSNGRAARLEPEAVLRAMHNSGLIVKVTAYDDSAKGTGRTALQAHIPTTLHGRRLTLHAARCGAQDPRPRQGGGGADAASHLEAARAYASQRPAD